MQHAETIGRESTKPARQPNSPKPLSDVERFKRRMLAWPNPVEYVNNMYGCHPGEDGTEYFEEVFRK